MLGKIFDQILHEDEEKELKKEVSEGNSEDFQKREKVAKDKTRMLLMGLGIFIIVLIPRLLYIFKFGNPNFPGWYTDTFHHWQIAYLSKEVGFHQGFLRLWDFKGMEFFWGLLHPLVLVVLFYLTGSTSILIPRLLSTFGGTLSIVFLFFIIRRYFNNSAAWAVVLFATFFPITLFSNTVGMQEELAQPFIFGGFLLWPVHPFIAGVMLALASMVRAEYWLFSFGLVLATLFMRKNKDKAIVFVVSYFLVIVFYMKYMLDYTGSPIFPIKLNFLASVKGEWFEDLPIVGEKLLAQRISRGIFAFGAIGSILTLLKKPKYSLLFLFGFGNILFIGFMVGFGSYVKGYIPRFWVDRLYNWPYLFTAILLLLLFFYFIPKWVNALKIPSMVLGWLILAAGIVASQLIWKPINYHMQPVEHIYNDEKSWAEEIARAYEGGRVLLPEDRPYVTYFLAHDFGIEGKNMVGQMFDPFFYLGNKEEPFNNWGEDREKVLDWLEKEQIELIALTIPKETYLGLVEREPQYFELVPSERLLLYRVILD